VERANVKMFSLFTKMPLVIFNVVHFLGRRYWGDVIGLFCVSGGVYQVILFYENYYALDPNLDEGVLMYIIYMGFDLFSLLCLGHKKVAVVIVFIKGYNWCMMHTCKVVIIFIKGYKWCMMHTCKVADITSRYNNFNNYFYCFCNYFTLARNNHNVVLLWKIPLFLSWRIPLFCMEDLLVLFISSK